MTGAGVPTQGATIQLTINTGKGFFNGRTTISSGDSSSSTVVPEPGSLSLLGTGLLAGATVTAPGYMVANSKGFRLEVDARTLDVTITVSGLGGNA